MSTIIPSFRYRDAQAAIRWLERALSFTRKAVYEKPDGTVEHAELVFGNGMIMLGSASNPSPYPQIAAHPDEIGQRVTSPAYVIVQDATTVYAAVQAAGGSIIMPLQEMSYGGKAFTCLDPEGYVWSVGEYDPWA
jgi:uncharacterized glyoxalase superfamily protein PhnB